MSRATISFPRGPRGLGCGLALGLGLAGFASGCGTDPQPARAPQGAPSPTSPPPAGLAGGRPGGAAADGGVELDAGAATSSACPPDMQHVQMNFCPDMERHCLKNEYDKANRLSICHRFKEGLQTCRAPRVALDFCIDRYEFPNELGKRPRVMVDWYEATGECAALGKRLCYESEWVAACEGPRETPFPYGWARSSEMCNIDNRWISPSLKKIYSPDPSISGPELERLWQGVPSGSKAGCVSGFGVHDLTGNVDEWALADRDRPEERAVFAALKGGAWGHVRNACRPVTTSHEPEFRYYFVSFRCCRDPGAG
ncbi:MAG: SUMF1/EgtB/PvdO family nonheme iron enzyme [Polyangiaceae bacterium]|nr:SUMF1/EgtB/PvdO family nonheme iron enzyme [Polyangiaceae bacterium]